MQYRRERELNNLLKKKKRIKITIEIRTVLNEICMRHKEYWYDTSNIFSECNKRYWHTGFHQDLGNCNNSNSFRR